MSSLKHILSYKHGNGRAQRHKRHGERRGTQGKQRPIAELFTGIAHLVLDLGGKGG